MKVTIRNIDGKLYLELKARAAREGRTIGAVLNDAIRSYLGGRRRRRFLDLEPVDFGPGNERLSEEIDEVVCLGGRFKGKGLQPSVDEDVVRRQD